MQTRMPGDDTQPDENKALAAGQRGGTHKVVKPKPQVPKSKVKGDPERPADAPVNEKKEMTYADAMKLRDEGKLTRNVLTDQGWVVRNETEAEKRAGMRGG